ncbi:hypothetical protein PHYPSEUDO_006180 [Phytophthora pseudosyringae]|uniref:Uncharacterized protein n=1 Tax=Phytophthora pseudosyringae TaxID=221518 RepID=A0A8T1VJ88_9STRA|nr:hypothetical protein PHYPSEUDO_006180 [Phytophthora pseudosyringae]
MLAGPVVSVSADSRVLYDTFATFTEDSVAYTYMLVDGVSYVSRQFVDDSSSSALVKCADSDILPSINSFVAALNKAEAVFGDQENSFNNQWKRDRVHEWQFIQGCSGWN